MIQHTVLMDAEERRDRIAEELRRRGRVSVRRLAAAHGVTPETVRRDLIELEERGELRRVHGGAVALERLRVEPAVAERSAHMAAAKAAIARAAVAQFPGDGGTVLVDAGTTTGALLEVWPTDRRLTVVTNAVPHALALAPIPTVTVIVIGGRLRARTLANVDEIALETLRNLRVEVAFVAANGVSERGCSTPDPAEAAVKRAMVGAADRVVLLADSTKFGQEHFVRFAAPADLDVVVTDGAADDGDLLPLRLAGAEVVVAP
ncbi:MAG TPA: DeoR/GlpR family DNA-binding transcription regulator [Acidimicrobiales bacterium]|nr:DeoR/GlpR family DNA-binding transcription regulator [Acidimicrobiales bacterium]